MNIREIVKQWLIANNFDGLYNDNYDGCGCEVKDLMPCDESGINCYAGYKAPCPGPEDGDCDGDCPWHITGKREVKDESRSD